eukprot:7581150-Pyramimonas_sp.AAC.1
MFMRLFRGCARGHGRGRWGARGFFTSERCGCCPGARPRRPDGSSLRRQRARADTLATSAAAARCAAPAGPAPSANPRAAVSVNQPASGSFMGYTTCADDFSKRTAGTVARSRRKASRRNEPGAERCVGALRVEAKSCKHDARLLSKVLGRREISGGPWRADPALWKG